MNKWVLLLLLYLSYLFIWFIVNLVAYFFSLALKRKIIDGLLGIAAVVFYILQSLLGLVLLWWAITTLLSGQFLFFLFLFFFGMSIFSWLSTLLQLPFLAIPGYFSEKFEKLDFVENVVRGEIIDKDSNQVIGVTEGNAAVSIKMAKYFLAMYFTQIGFLLVFPTEREGLILGDYIVKPFIWVITTTLFFGFFYSIFHKIKNKAFFPDDKRYFFIKVWKMSLYILIPSGILLYLLAWITNTL